MKKVERKVGAATKRTKKVAPKKKAAKKSVVEKAPAKKATKKKKAIVSAPVTPLKRTKKKKAIVSAPEEVLPNTVISINGITLYTLFAGANCVDDVFNSRTTKLKFSSVVNEHGVSRLAKLSGRVYEIAISYTKGGGVQQGAVPATIKVDSVLVTAWLRPPSKGTGIAKVALEFTTV